jgi:hypothetical protein
MILTPTAAAAVCGSASGLYVCAGTTTAAVYAYQHALAEGYRVLACGAAYQRWTCVAGAAPAACACGHVTAANFPCEAL